MYFSVKQILYSCIKWRYILGRPVHIYSACIIKWKLQIVNPTGVLMGRIGVITVDWMCYHAHLDRVQLIQILSE